MSNCINCGRDLGNIEEGHICHKCYKDGKWKRSTWRM